MKRENLIVKLSEIKLNEDNPRTIKDRQMKRLVKSIQDFPEMTQLRPIVIDENNVILGGNMRYRAMQQLGYADTEVVKVSGLTDEQKREFIIKDNVPFGDWDWDELANSWDTQELSEWGLVPEEWASKQKEYDDFVEKFEPKKTTDDCYTPPAVMEAVTNWTKKAFDISKSTRVIRPFYPDGDYQAEDYSGDCCVIDNPPFSILSEIVRWYTEHNVRYFLFAPSMTTAATAPDCEKALILSFAPITYENGAVVNTSFITNMANSEVAIMVSKELNEAIADAQPPEETDLAAYDRPANCMTVTDFKRFAYCGDDLTVKHSQVQFVRNIDALKDAGKGLYGGGFLVSDKVAEKAKAEKAKAENVRAENVRAAIAKAEKVWTEKERIPLALSAAEIQIVEGLNRKESANG